MDKGRIDTFIRVAVTVIVTILLVVPIFVLSYIQVAGWKPDLVVLAFTLIFALSLAAFTKARRHELFGATAAYVFLILPSRPQKLTESTDRYCAVLVVFLGSPSFTFSSVGSNWSSGAVQNVTLSN